MAYLRVTALPRATGSGASAPVAIGVGSYARDVHNSPAAGLHLHVNWVQRRAAVAGSRTGRRSFRASVGAAVDPGAEIRPFRGLRRTPRGRLPALRRPEASTAPPRSAI